MVRLLTMAAALAIGCGGSSAEAPRTEARAVPVHSSPAQPTEVERPTEPERPAEEPAVVLVHGEGEPVRVRVELAVTPAQRQRGLMHRRSLPRDAGMLFVFPRMEHQSFWMDNTYIPLDMIFIDDDLRVVGVVEDAEPLTEDAREVEGDSRYVLEVNAGFARRHGIGPGTRVRFENLPSWRRMHTEEER